MVWVRLCFRVPLPSMDLTNQRNYMRRHHNGHKTFMLLKNHNWTYGVLDEKQTWLCFSLASLSDGHISPCPTGCGHGLSVECQLCGKVKQDFHISSKSRDGMSTLSLMDVVCCLAEFTLCDKAYVQQPAYNLHADHLTTAMLAQSLQNRFPDTIFTFDPQWLTDIIIANWRDVIRDAYAQYEWGWKHRLGFEDAI